MPLYVYRCPEGHKVEEFRSVSNRDDLIFCENCPPIEQGDGIKFVVMERIEYPGCAINPVMWM